MKPGVPKAAPHQRWMNTTISFGPSDCPEKFTKWPEVTPVLNITKKSAVAFLRSIVCRFGVPNRIIADNGTQFKSRLFQEYCEDIGI